MLADGRMLTFDEARARVLADATRLGEERVALGEADGRVLAEALVADPSVDAVVTTGGTGIAPRDQSYEAIDGLLERRLDGFGEAFRRLSWAEVGPRAILSRAVAGTFGGKIVAALPGSPRALALAVEQILAPVLPHAAAQAAGRAGQH